MKRFLWLLIIPLWLLASLAGGAWLWLGSDTSLATALQQAARWLPAGQTLEAQDVRGSVRRGGHIGSLRYHGPGLAVEAQDVALSWQLRPLLQRELRLDQLRIATLRITQTPSADPTPAPTEIVLPFTLHLPFDIATLDWAGPPALQATQVSGNYSFDSTLHKLDLRHIQISSGSYSAQAQLQAHSPMALQATLQGTLDSTLPGTTHLQPQALHIQASAAASGPLAGPDALLQVQATLAPGSPLQARLNAQIKPWADQPIHQADAQFQQLNLADLWPQAPQTLLNGSLQVTPDGTGWRAQARVDNRLSGPWDTHRVPLDQLQTRLQYRQGTWLVDSLSARLGQGELQASGQQTASDWTVQARLRRINPAALHRQLDAALLDGSISARSSGPAIQFDAALQPAAAPPSPPSPQASVRGLHGLHLRNAQAVGHWAAGMLSLSRLRLETDDALLQGQLDFTPASRAAQGQLQLTLPGALADLQGQISATQGAGDAKLSIRDADQASRWLARLPGIAARLPTATVKGQAELAAHWRGGWASTDPATLQAQLRVPTLEVRTPAATGTPISLQQLQLDLSGSLQALDIRLQGALASGTRRVQLNSQASANLATPHAWQARIASLALQLQDSSHPGTWTLQLDQALTLQLARSPQGSSLDAAAGSASLSGPVPGTARIAWQPLAWAQNGTQTQLRSSGTLQGLPMGWLDAMAASAGQLAQLGLKGDLLLDGDWNLQAGPTLQVSANLARRSGDLQLLTGDDAPGSKTANTISAGIRTARIGLRSDGNSLSASLRWDSERAGQAEADFSTQIRQTADGGTHWTNWEWPADAPLSGSLHAALPRVGIWSVLAPPGWRMRGTLAADARLGGSRAAPLWSGTLQADDLALRSVVEGIELRDGRLRAQLDGQRLNITEFSLRGAPSAADSKTGAPGNDGGRLSASGTAQWGTQSAAPAGIQLDLQAQASGLRISARADRRLAVSGTLQAQLAQGKLVLQGALKADQALFILPEETAPSLGSDVRVRSKVATPVASAAPVASPKTPHITLALDLGDDFHLVGRGIDTRLAGQLTLRAGPTLAGPRLTGELRTVRGSYRAYSQNLDIDAGVLRFNGPFDNPALDILAIRPNLSVRVGVQITGTALSPSIRLYSESDLSDAEKLAWLVLGRSAANGGAEAAVLQQAALALLGGNGKGISGGLASALGLDELSFSGSASNTDGSTSAAAVTFGKRLSRDFYVSYEHSLAGTLGTLYIFYDLSKRFTLRAQTGEQSAIDLVFTLQYD